LHALFSEPPLSTAEVAGLLLGGIPIAIWALEKYAEPWETYHDYRRAMETLQADLKMQQRQLELTFANVGLCQPSMGELRNCFETEYPEIASELLVIVERMEDIVADLLKDLRVDINKKVLL